MNDLEYEMTKALYGRWFWVWPVIRFLLKVVFFSGVLYVVLRCAIHGS